MIWKLRNRFFVQFVALGMLVFFSTVLALLLQYGGKYREDTYTNTLSTAISLAVARIPIDRERLAALRDAAGGDQDHALAVSGLLKIREDYNLNGLRLLQLRVPGSYRIVLDAASMPGFPTVDYMNSPHEGIEDVYQTKIPLITPEYPGEGGVQVSAFFPVVENGQVIAIWTAGLFRRDIPSLLGYEQVALLVAFVISASIAVLFALSASGSMTKSIVGIEKVASSLADMRFDIEIPVTRKDEIGQMQRMMVRIRDSLKLHFNLLGGSATRVSTAVYDLSSSAREISTTAAQQSASVTEIVGTMENSRAFSSRMTQHTEGVVELASDVESLSGHGVLLHKGNETMMDEIRKQNDKVVEQINNLTEVLSRINEAVQFIDDIADRTKLIAFNAALEASSAGAAGLRFTVVAGEIRRFADNVGTSVVTIKERISELRDVSGFLISEAALSSDTIGQGYKRLVEQKEAFENITYVARNAATSSKDILELGRQQEIAAEQSLLALQEISAGGKQFMLATGNTSRTVDDLAKMAGELRESLARFQEGGKKP
ncbi:MAG: methyl-accepting chemotaxis protein [Treponema sp.]|nr:methyl-accepting chemotaxis protein [Treponema sp.]